jgi:hypothetical protein
MKKQTGIGTISLYLPLVIERKRGVNSPHLQCVTSESELRGDGLCDLLPVVGASVCGPDVRLCGHAIDSKIANSERNCVNSTDPREERR